MGESPVGTSADPQLSVAVSADPTQRLSPYVPRLVVDWLRNEPERSYREVEGSQQGRYLRHEGPGDFFGEIALLRDVPRTATVVATTPTALLVISREVFLDAVTGNRESQTAAEEIVTRRLLA